MILVMIWSFHGSATWGKSINLSQSVFSICKKQTGMTARALSKGLLQRAAVREDGDKLRYSKHSVNSRFLFLQAPLPVYTFPKTHQVSWP